MAEKETAIRVCRSLVGFAHKRKNWIQTQTRNINMNGTRNYQRQLTYHISTFSEHGSFFITSGGIQAYVPAKDMVILLSISCTSLLVPKSDIFRISLCPTRILKIDANGLATISQKHKNIERRSCVGCRGTSQMTIDWASTKLNYFHNLWCNNHIVSIKASNKLYFVIYKVLIRVSTVDISTLVLIYINLVFHQFMKY